MKSLYSAVSVAAVVVAVVWFFLTGAVWQFVPVGAAIVTVHALKKLLDPKEAS